MVLCAVVKFLHKLGHVHTERPKCLPNRWTWFCCCRRDTKHYISDYRHILGLGGPTVSNGKGKLKRKKNLHHFQFFIFKSNFLQTFYCHFVLISYLSHVLSSHAAFKCTLSTLRNLGGVVPLAVSQPLSICLTFLVAHFSGYPHFSHHHSNLFFSRSAHRK